jgi:tRNA(fMet)-specific endonuclease VapC
VLDTTVLVNHLRSADRTTTITRLEGKTQLATTIINVFELYFGAYKSKDVKRNLAAVKGLRSTLQVLNLTESSAERAGKVLAGLEAKGQPLDPRDLFVAAICLEQGFAILTDNMDHFERVPDLETVPEKELSKALRRDLPVSLDKTTC